MGGRILDLVVIEEWSYLLGFVVTNYKNIVVETSLTV